MYLFNYRKIFISLTILNTEFMHIFNLKNKKK